MNEFAIGKPLPPWKLLPILEDKVPKVEDYKGKPLLILFYYMGCNGCKGRALPYGNRIVYENKGVNVIGIHSRFNTKFNTKIYSKEEHQKVKKEFYVRFPIFDDYNDNYTFNKYKCGGTPHWILVDKNGVVVYSIFGSDPNNALLKLDLKIAEVLEE